MNEEQRVVNGGRIYAFPSGEDITEQVLAAQEQAQQNRGADVFGDLHKAIETLKEVPVPPELAVLVVRYPDDDLVFSVPQEADYVHVEHALRRAAELVASTERMQ